MSTNKDSNATKLKYYVINLKSQTERRERMAKLLEAQGVDYEFFEGVNGRALTDEQKALFADEDKNVLEMTGGRKLIVEDKLSPSEKGCALSHLKLYQKILDDGVQRAVILEDDLILNQDVYEALDNIDCIKEPWDIINFSSHIGIKSLPGAKKYYANKEKGFYFQRLGMRNNTLDAIFNRRRVLVCAALYVVTPVACKRLIELGYPVRIVADYLTGLVGYHNLRLFRAYPLNHFINFHEVASTIGDRPEHRMVRL